MVDHYEIIDLLRKVNEAVATVRSQVAKPEPDRYEVLNYLYKPGDIVKDKVTGLEGEVIHGERILVSF